MTPVKVNILPNGLGLDLPGYSTPQSAGLDLRAAISKDLAIRPGDRVLIPTGLAIALTDGLEAQVRPRSGMALKHGVTVLNSPGTIDADYRGEIGVILINHGQNDFGVTRGDRIAQLVVARFEQVELVSVNSLDESTRSSGGFGSTGS